MLARRLAEAIAWCGPRANPADPAESLRTPALRPGFFLQPDWTVNDLCDNRARQLGASGSPCEGHLAGGRLLGYAPAENMRCGAAQVVSREFFDLDNIPPWDTWVAYCEGYMIAWVPPAFLALANDGIEVNPELCIEWVERRPHPLVEELRKLGLS